jgi:hypothetical protein
MTPVLRLENITSPSTSLHTIDEYRYMNYMSVQAYMHTNFPLNLCDCDFEGKHILQMSDIKGKGKAIPVTGHEGP